MSPSWAGCQPMSSRVRALDAGLSTPMKPPNQLKCSPAPSGEMDTTGTSRCRPITSAMSRIGTPSSATEWSVDRKPATVRGERTPAVAGGGDHRHVHGQRRQCPRRDTDRNPPRSRSLDPHCPRIILPGRGKEERCRATGLREAERGETARSECPSGVNFAGARPPRPPLSSPS